MSTNMHDAIDLWHGWLAEDGFIDRRYWDILDEAERESALKLKRPDMQARYVEVHGKMRRILAHYLQIEAERIVIGKEEHGRPYLVGRPEWVFNLSHSADRFVLVVSRNCRLGVDIELSKPRVNLEGLVGKCFSVEEREYWEALPESEKTSEFYRFWTRKEAFVKATGRGIALGMEQCVINSTDPKEMLRVPENCGLASDWRVVDIDLGLGFACAVVNDRGVNIISMTELDDELAATL